MTDGVLLEMHVGWAFDGPEAGAVIAARRTARGAMLEDGTEVALDRTTALPEGARFLAEVVRMAIPEAGRLKPARVRVAQGPARAAPTLGDRLAAAGHRVRQGFPADVEEAWTSGWEAAALGRWPVPEGVLRLSPTPALLAVDVDGPVDAEAAAVALATAVRLWGLGGSIVADFPTRPGRDWRQAAVAAFDRAMGGLPFERTAINGFGLLQVVRPRVRPSILERALLMRDAADAIALLELAARETRPGPIGISARPGVARLLRGRPDLLAAAGRLAGRPVDVVEDSGAGTGHVAVG
jgi:hypothetical protein